MQISKTNYSEPNEVRAPPAGNKHRHALLARAQKQCKPQLQWQLNIQDAYFHFKWSSYGLNCT